MPGRSTQSELLAHYNDIYEAIIEEKRLDTVFLDFDKAFDKVDHAILLEKVKEQGIGGKLGKWIEGFLKNRKFRVVVNGCCSTGNHSGGDTIYKNDDIEYRCKCKKV